MFRHISEFREIFLVRHLKDRFLKVVLPLTYSTLYQLFLMFLNVLQVLIVTYLVSQSLAMLQIQVIQKHIFPEHLRRSTYH